MDALATLPAAITLLPASWWCVFSQNEPSLTHFPVLSLPQYSLARDAAGGPSIRCTRPLAREKVAPLGSLL